MGVLGQGCTLCFTNAARGLPVIQEGVNSCGE